MSSTVTHVQHDRAPRRPRSILLQLGFLVAVVAAASFERVILAPLQEHVQRSLGLSDFQIGWVQGPITTWPMVAACVPLGFLLDRFSRVRVMLFFVALALVGSLLTAFASNLTELVIARGVAGLATFAVNPIACALIADMFAEAVRGRASTALAAGQTLGAAGAFAMGGWALAAATAGGGDWRAAMLWMCVPAALALCGASLLREPQVARTVRMQSHLGDGWQSLWASRKVLLPLIIGITAVEIVLSVGVWIGPALSRRFGMDPSETGAIVGSIFLVAGLLGPLVGGFLADLLRRTHGPETIALGLALLSALSLPTSLFASLGSSPAATVCVGILIALASACALMTNALFTLLVPAQARGLFFASFVGLVLLFAGATPLLVGALSQAFSGPLGLNRALTSVCASSMLLAVSAYGYAWYKLRRYISSEL